MPEQLDLLPEEESTETPEAAAEREAYRERLREYLQDADFRAIEGFPIGEDEAILALSDPPYYTACPNPFLPEIIEKWQAERAELRAELGLPDDSHDNGNDDSPPPSSGEHRERQASHGPGVGVYHREPFAADVSEGKNDPIYNAHSYHTKVPHKAIMRYILHYTDPGDIVFDGFCGTGMTGVAAQLCGDKKAVESLGYRVTREGTILDEKGEAISRLGARKAALVDLSPAATFIAYNYNTPVDGRAFERDVKRILDPVKSQLGWMYETWHPHCDDPNRIKGHINYTVWSEVFACPHCGKELVYFDAAVDKQTFRVKKEFSCPGCQAKLLKKELQRVWETRVDDALQQPHQLVRFRPVLINCQVNGRRLEKQPDDYDLDTLNRIRDAPIDDWYPVHEMPDGERKGKDGYHLKGITHLHHFYFRRALMSLARLWAPVRPALGSAESDFSRFFVQGSGLGFTKMNRYSANHYSQVNRYFSGTLFVGSLISEVSPAYSMNNKLDRLRKLKLPGRWNQAVITTQSATELRNVPSSVVDYVFVDPPFGNNLHYSELNFFWEAWLEVLTGRDPEAVMDKGRKRGLADYQELMALAFQEIYRVLRPRRWMTVEFHNSRNSVWNAIQEAMLRAGFVVADVRTLDKQQETYKQSIQKLVKQDLVISAYKPATAFERTFLAEGGSEDAAWSFVRQHLAQLPIPETVDNAMEMLVERQAFLLYDRMVAFHVQRGVVVPLSAAKFYAGLKQRFPERDDMYFLPEQAAEYDKRRMSAERVEQLALFLTDEKSAIQWLRRELGAETGNGPQTFQDVQPKFLKELRQARHEELPELLDILKENFLQDDAERWYVPDPERQGDLEKLRERTLLREFQDYASGKGKLKVFRTEAVRAGFGHAWRERDYKLILKVAERLPPAVLQEDPDLLMYVDNAGLRAGDEPEQQRMF